MSIVNLNPRMTEYNKLANQALGAGANHLSFMDGLSGGLIGIGAITAGQELIKGGKWIHQNKGNYSNAWDAVKQAQETRKLEQAALKGNNFGETTRNRMGNSTLKTLSGKYAEIPTDYIKYTELKSARQRRKYFNQTKKSQYYKEVRELIAKAKGAKGAELKNYLKQIDKAVAKANLNIHNAKLSGNLKPITRLGKTISKIKRYSGYTNLAGKAAEKQVASKTFRTLAKGAKGNALFAGIALLAETPDLIKTFKECGTEKGTKQLGKTAVVIGAEVGGYAAGAAAGAAIGAAIGTAACPVIGTAIGAVCGIAVSCLTGWLARKAVGKSELEKKKGFDAIELAHKAKNDPTIKKQLEAQKAEQSDNSENLTDEEAKATIESYEQQINESETDSEQTSETEDNTELIYALQNLGKFGSYTAA